MVQALPTEQHPFKGRCTGDGQLCAYFAPTDMPINAVADYLRGARRKIQIATYNMDVDDYSAILNQRMDAGVRVEYMVDLKLSFGSNSVWRSLTPRPQLERYRIPVLRGGLPQMHNKMIIIDDSILLLGSANFTYSGLVANYENVMAIKDTSTIRKFQDEFAEHKAISQAACDIFAANRSLCGSGNESWDLAMLKFLTAAEPVVDPATGRTRTVAAFPENVLEMDKILTQVNGADTKEFPCSELRSVGTAYCSRRPSEGPGRIIACKGHGLTDEGNRPRMQNIHQCFKPGMSEKIEAFLTRIAAIEKTADGRLTSAQTSLRQDLPRTGSICDASLAQPRRDAQTGPNRAYFSPEDDVERVVVDELCLAAVDPQNSYVMVSTNFITNKQFFRALIDLKNRGVRMNVLYDLGRAESAEFMKLAQLQEADEGLGFLNFESLAGHPSYNQIRSRESGQPFVPANPVITLFDNTLTGPYGCNHNKMAVVKSARGLRLLNGSANWSGGAMDRNDENYVISENEEIATIYLQEIFSQFYAYRDMQNSTLPRFSADYDFVKRRTPCFDEMMTGRPCQGRNWTPSTRATMAVSVEGVPANSVTESVWAYSSELGFDQHMATELFTHGVFGGRWLTSIPLAINQEFGFKLFIANKGFDPSVHDLRNPEIARQFNIRWEYEGIGNERRSRMPELTVQKLPGTFTWGRP
jgi:phosphatidylserine/phosphatidylglycerophosphate/cardiolipin synthase-like enzyme